VLLFSRVSQWRRVFLLNETKTLPARLAAMDNREEEYDAKAARGFKGWAVCCPVLRHPYLRFYFCRLRLVARYPIGLSPSD
jgi:hypothetical protein